MYSFLMIGQSNMAGRGFRNEVPEIKNNRLYVLRNGRWQNMYFPVNNDRSFSGVSLAESFADECSKYYNTDIGLIPCADGGTKLDQWQPGELLYDHALSQAKLAQRTSKIAGVLWHQGESDCDEKDYPLYEEKCIYIFESLKEELRLSDETPFLIGGLGDFLVNYGGIYCNYFKVNHALQNIAQTHDYIGYVSAKELTCNPDNLHFNAPSLRKFGIRYFEKFKEMNCVINGNEHDKFITNYSEIEKL